MAKTENLTLDSVSQCISYDHCTGVFLRISSKIRPDKCGKKAGWVEKSTGYLRIQIGQNREYAHRLAFLIMTGKYPEGQIDHIDGNRTNNCWSNLREVSQSESSMNTATRRDNKCGVKGVHWLSRDRKWGAEIVKNKIRTKLGYFDNFEDAVKARKEAEERIHGKYARAS
jgi:hypothetical protein